MRLGINQSHRFITWGPSPQIRGVPFVHETILDGETSTSNLEGEISETSLKGEISKTDLEGSL